MVALITGGAAGIGRGLAYECAKQGYDVILASLPSKALEKTVVDFETEFPSINVYKYAVDFLKENAVEDLHTWVIEKKLNVDVLVNNVGLGSVGPFENSEMKFYEVMIALNVRITTRMCHAFLSHLQKSKKGFLLNVSSFAGTVPVPNKAVYSSTKAYVLNLTLSLRHELKSYGVKVAALCPGAVVTSPEVQERIKAAGYFSMKSALYPNELAKITFKRLNRGDSVIIPGKLNAFFNFLLTVLPLDIRNTLMAKAFK